MNNKTKQQQKEKIALVKRTLLFLILLIPVLMLFAYTKAFPMMNLWDLFVEQIFGSFWMAVLFIGLFFFIILMLGGITYYTVIMFMMFYILAMAIGYSFPLFSVGISAFAMMYFLYQLFKWWENR